MRELILAGSVLLAASAASAATYVPVVPVSGSTATNIQGINDKNQIVGYYDTSDGLEHGFAGTTDGSYQTFDLGSRLTRAHRINNMGTIVGNADDGQNDGYNVAFERSWTGGKTVDVKIGHTTLLDGQTFGISSAGTIVGYGFDPNGFAYHAYYGRKGRYVSDLTISQSALPAPRGINASNVVVGVFQTDPNFTSHGFVLQSGVSTQIDYPDAAAKGTELNDINDGGMATGDWLDVHHRPHPFRYDTTTATFFPMRLPGTHYGQAWGINSHGVIAVTSDVGSFLYCPTAKRCPASGAVVSDGAPIRAPQRR